MPKPPLVNSIFDLASQEEDAREAWLRNLTRVGTGRNPNVPLEAERSLATHLAYNCCGVFPFHPLIPRQLSAREDQLRASPTPLLRSWSAAIAVSSIIADAQQLGGLRKNDYPSRVIQEALRHWLLRHAADAIEGQDSAGLFHKDAPRPLQVLAGQFPTIDGRRMHDRIPGLIHAHKNIALDLIADCARDDEIANDAGAKTRLLPAFDPSEFWCNCAASDKPKSESQVTSLMEAASSLTSPLELEAFEHSLSAAEGNDSNGLWTAMAGALLRIVWFHLGHIPRGHRGGVSSADQILVRQVQHVLRAIALEHRRAGEWRARAAMASALLAAFESLWRWQPGDVLLQLQQQNASLPAAFTFRTIDTQSSTLQQVRYCLEMTAHAHKLNPARAAAQLGELAHIISSELTDPLGFGYQRSAEAVEVDRNKADKVIHKRFEDLANDSKMGRRAEQTYSGPDTMARVRWRTRMSRNVEYFGWMAKVTAEVSQREADRPAMTNRVRLAESLIRAEDYLEQRR